jgi:chromate transporter
MADGLGLAETTPGPLIMVTQFVGYLAGLRAPAPFTPLVGGLLAAALTTWVTFVPCFVWIFALAPWMERLERAPRLKGALAGITAAVVGVIANLSVWFALHVLFSRSVAVPLLGGAIALPDPSSLDWRAAVLATLAALLIFRARWSMIRVLGVAAAGGLALGLLA